VTRDLPPHALRRLLDAAAPLRERPHLGALDEDRYEIRREIGRGGTSVVYEAWDLELQRWIALKVLHLPLGLSDEARGRFSREAKAAARLVHPHIAAVYDATPEAIAMQRVQGETLAACGVRDPRALAALMRDAALAIHYAHGEGVVHRDLKPANLMVERGERPHVFVMDFGLAKELAVDASVSLSGSVVGTPAFMAPEQAAGRSEAIGLRTDVYGLGVTLWAALAGRPPFRDDDVVRLLRRVVEEEPPPLSGVARVDRDLATIVAKCMEKEPSRRYASALEVASDLDRWLRGEPVHARAPSVAYRLRRYLSRRQGVVVASLVAALLAGLVALPFVIHARASRSSAEAQRRIGERVFALSERVNQALRDARAMRGAGVGRERDAHAILEAAIADCRALLEETELAHVRYFLGRLLREQGRDDEALAAFDRAAAQGAEIPALPLDRGLVLASLWRDGLPVGDEPPLPELEAWRERALVDLRLALAVEPEVLTAGRVFAEGMLAWLEGDLDGAVAKLREATEMDYNLQEAHLSLARLYLDVGRDDLAMHHSIVASDLLRGNLRAYGAPMSIAPVVDAAGDPLDEWLALEGMDELLVDFYALFQLEPTECHAYGLRAQARLRQAARALVRGAVPVARDELETAERELDGALTLEPASVPALVGRGVCRALLGRITADRDPSRAAEALAGALADYDAALAAHPDSAIALYDRALLREHRARLAEPLRRPGMASDERRAALADAARAAGQVPRSSPWRERLAARAEALEAALR